ncbi:MAG: PadR family transcriptional regulator [Anaerolineae bacterium]|nr:PadR family transcriptional regulator [Anaerolineae bacterium]
MSLQHAILGLLTIQPMSGYELKHVAFEQTIAHFWQADQAQIYRTLDKMAESGWITSQLEIQETRPNRKIYSLTSAGRAELERWMGTEQPLPTYREAFLVQLFFGEELAQDDLLKHITTHIAGHRERLAAYEQIPLPKLDDASIETRETFWRLTLEFGIALEKTYLEWLEMCARVIGNQPGE